MVKEFHATYRTQMFNALFTRAHQLRGPVKILMAFYDEHFFTPRSSFRFGAPPQLHPYLLASRLLRPRRVEAPCHGEQQNNVPHTCIKTPTFFDVYNTSVRDQVISHCV